MRAGWILRRAAAPAAAIAAAVLAAAPAQGAGPDVRFVTVTDVTPRSFQVVWLSSDPATATLRLFEAPACVNEIFTADVEAFPTIAGGSAIPAAARQKGVMSVRASDLLPDTEYCVQTVTTSLFSGQVTAAPDPPLLVRTALRTTRARPAGPSDPNEVGFSNDLAKVAVTRSDPLAATAGALLLVKIAGAVSPLASWVGDGIDDDADANTPAAAALVDLNNLYDAATGGSLDLKGDGSEEISARVLGSPEGFVTVHARLVPEDHGLAEVVAPDPCPGAGQTACDGRLGDADADGAITEADAAAIRDFVVGLTSVIPCRACGDAFWDLDDDMKDALAIAQAAAGLRLLPW